MLLVSLALLAPAADPAPADQAPNTWVKRSPLPGGPPSPGLAYEASLVWDGKNRRVIRWAGHNQSGGGEQNAEVWALEPLSGRWELKEPNTSPPGACCNQQNLFDADRGRMLRFPAFSGSHGWHWFRENYLSNSTVWDYDLATNTWRDRRPAPAPRVSPLRCASWDGDYQVALVFGGEGSREGTLVYDPYTNTWHRLKPKDEPDPRSGGNLAYDSANKLHVLFGTQFDDDPLTWTFDLRKNEWRGRKVSGPPTDRNDPVMAYDNAGKRTVALVRAIDKSQGKEPVAGHLESWEFDATSFAWRKLNPAREPDGWPNRRRIMVAAPELNLLVCEAYVNPTDKVKGADREQQIWTYRYAKATPAGLLPPANVRVTALERGARVQWDKVPGAAKYVVFAGTGEAPWAAKYEKVGEPDRPNVIDEGAARGKVTYYRVKAVTADGRESDLSPVARAQPRVADDVVASVVSAKEVRLAWKPVEGAVGYHVERAPVEVFTEDQLVRLKKDTEPLAEPSVGAVKLIGKFERLTKDPVAVKPGIQVGANQFTDASVDLTKPTKVEGEPTFAHRFAKEQIDEKGKPYRFGVHAYRVRAVNALGVEGGPSAWALTVPSAVQNVFAKEDGTTCRLKWAANPETGVEGYRVYRMDGPKVNGPGQKVLRRTADPLKEPTYSDEAKATGTRRYWVVAVDALGQEGVPSAPAWGWRQYKKVYDGFAGEWHQ
jgi:fibronectin type 3 domain-containing protein